MLLGPGRILPRLAVTPPSRFGFIPLGPRDSKIWYRRRYPMRKLGLPKKASIVFLFCVATMIASPAQTTFTTLANFDGTNGESPTYVSLVQGFDGNFYGTTFEGGTGSCGTVFKITAAGTLTTMHNFVNTDGCLPYPGLVQATNGDLYGITSAGGAALYGTVFKLTPAGTLTTLHTFCHQSPGCTGGYQPLGTLVQASNGIFYGTTAQGGSSRRGTVFKITAGGTLTTLHSFNGTDGEYPIAGLVQASNGDFYGTTSSGGASGNGTVFKITADGTLTTLHNFHGTDGAQPLAAPIQAADGEFYGTTELGGANNLGTVFKIASGGALTTLHSFDGTDGEYPVAALVQATDGNFYGTTSVYDGTVFEITPSGTLTTLHAFDGTDGSNVSDGLVQATDGTFYGTTYAGGTDNYGTVFSISVGLGPFVETLPTSGKAGATVIILGNNLTGATAVSFNGKTTVFTVVSSTEIKTTVPTAATTGTVEVTTPSGALKSNVSFRVP